MSTPISHFDFGGPPAADRHHIIHFAHANAYPPGCYRAVIAPLLDDHSVVAMKLRPLWPGSKPEEVDNWQVVADDVIRFFDQEGLRGVVGIGHSLGAVATMFAALKRPDLFRALVLIEPVFLPPHILEMARQHPEASSELPLVQQALKRRTHWPDRQAAFDHFRRKKVFARWPDETLRDYVRAGLADDGDKVSLVYPRDWEAQFYALPPTSVWEDIPRISHPTLAVRGAASDTIMPDAWQRWQSLQPSATFVEMADAGHLVPMERPRALAGAIHNWLASSNQ